jgi:predicted aconitase with swiveling domain
MIVRGEMLVEGAAEGEVFALAEPLSFWGGFDAATGNVIDHRHPDLGQCLTGRIVVVAAARGSSSGSSVLAEAIRAKTAPAGFVIATRDAILTVGAQVAAELYAIHCPIVCVCLSDLTRLARPGRIAVTATTTGAELVHSPHV